jgi:tetratricopeptide (TPR) repeat protein
MTRFTSLAAVLPFLLASFALAGDLEDAQALQKAGKFEEALPKYQAAFAADATNPAAALGLCQVLAGLGRYDEASKCVDDARKAHPENAALMAAKGRANFLGMLKEKSRADEAGEDPDDGTIERYKSAAEKWADAALKADKKNVEGLILRGQIWQFEANDEQTRFFFEQAAAADPKSFDAAFELANYWYVKAGQNNKDQQLWTQAENAFAAALALDPTSARAAANVAHCKAWRKQPPKEVSAAYLKALELAPADDKLLAKLYQWTPLDDRAELFQKLAEAEPKNIQRKRFLAFALCGPPWRNYEKALQVLESAAQLDPKNPWIPLDEGDVKLGWGKHDDEAIENYVEAMTLFKDAGGIDNDAYLRLAFSVAFQSQKLSEEQREKIWLALTKIFPERADAANNAGLWFRDVGKDYKKSLEWYLKAVKAAPEDCCIQNDTGLIYHYHMNDFEKAEPYYRKAVEIGKAQKYDCNTAKDPDRGFRDALNNMHMILAAKKRWKELKKFAEEDVPDAHPQKEIWIKEAESKSK